MKKSKIVAGLLSTLSVLAIAIPSGTAVYASEVDSVIDVPTTTESIDQTLKWGTIGDLEKAELENLFTAIMNIPEEVVASGDAEEMAKYTLAYGIDINNVETRGIVGCIAAITLVVGSAVAGAGLVADAIRFVKAAGSVAVAAEAIIALVQEGNSAALQKFGNTLISLASAVLGIDTIKSNCS